MALRGDDFGGCVLPKSSRLVLRGVELIASSCYLIDRCGVVRRPPRRFGSVHEHQDQGRLANFEKLPDFFLRSRITCCH